MEKVRQLPFAKQDVCVASDSFASHFKIISTAEIEKKF
jgi:hypothetical protein